MQHSIRHKNEPFKHKPHAVKKVYVQMNHEIYFRRNHQNSVKHARKKPTKLEVSWEFFEFTH